MRSFVLSCPILCAFAGLASAAEQGIASYYHSAYHSARYGGLIAAHRSLPMGSQVRVVNLENGRDVVVRIVDRGPFLHGRIIDVSIEAAAALGFRQAGLAHVRVDPMSPEATDSPPPPVEQAVASTPDQICKRDPERMRSELTSQEAKRFESELACGASPPQLAELGSPAPARAEVSSESSTEAKTSPGLPDKIASAAPAKSEAQVAPSRARLAASRHRFQARRYSHGCASASCLWRGRELLAMR